MTKGHNRRRFLQLTGTGAAATLAGCAAINPLSDDADADEVLTAAVGPDPEEVDELIEAIESGEIDQDEVRNREQELIQNAIEDFEERVENDSDLTIEESAEQFGLYQIDGSAEAIVSALREGAITELHRAAAYDQFLEGSEQQQQQQPDQESDQETEQESGEAEETDEDGSGDEEGGAGDGEDDSAGDEDAETDDETGDSDDSNTDDTDDGNTDA